MGAIKDVTDLAEDAEARIAKAIKTLNWSVDNSFLSDDTFDALKDDCIYPVSEIFAEIADRVVMPYRHEIKRLQDRMSLLDDVFFFVGHEWDRTYAEGGAVSPEIHYGVAWHFVLLVLEQLHRELEAAHL